MPVGAMQTTLVLLGIIAFVFAGFFGGAGIGHVTVGTKRARTLGSQIGMVIMFAAAIYSAIRWGNLL